MKFGIQKFLNPVHSQDSGYIKFSVRPNGDGEEVDKARYFGHTVLWQMADCSEYIKLDFDGWHFYHFNDKGPPSKSRLNESLSTIKDRRKKLHLFVDSVNKMADKVFQAMDQDEATFKKMLEETDGTIARD